MYLGSVNLARFYNALTIIIHAEDRPAFIVRCIRTVVILFSKRRDIQLSSRTNFFYLTYCNMRILHVCTIHEQKVIITFIINTPSFVLLICRLVTSNLLPRFTPVSNNHFSLIMRAAFHFQSHFMLHLNYICRASWWEKFLFLLRAWASHLIKTSYLVNCQHTTQVSTLGMQWEMRERRWKHAS